MEDIDNLVTNINLNPPNFCLSLTNGEPIITLKSNGEIIFGDKVKEINEEVALQFINIVEEMSKNINKNSKVLIDKEELKN